MKTYIMLVFIMLSVVANAQEKRSKKVQEVNFDGTDIDGQSRRPDGSYLVQKRGIDFVPLYNVRKKFDDSIKESVEYLK